MKIESMSSTQIKQKIEEYQFIIDRCRDYINRTSPMTFLGPFGARVKIKKYENKIKLLKEELRCRAD